LTENLKINMEVRKTGMAFDTVLIANRGEIALRIIRACNSLDLKSVAVFSDADKSAPYVGAADKAVHIGASEAANSYLNMGKIIEAAKSSGAGAIHPGYGFLAENAEFAKLCAENGLVFIGPSADLIEKMGSKIEAKSVAIETGVPVVPGYHSADQSADVLTQAAKDVGVPLMIKASAGGGGRGMRLVTDLADFSNELNLAQKEAKAAFGDPAVLLERYVENARHIEVQILGDQHGNVVHLFERDCSIQRNHQKVIEEAPAPNLPEKIRSGILTAAVNLARHVSYDSAGTVEFIYDVKREEFYFLEMNTRLQVEHPVTEEITGIDLVQWQIAIAQGEGLTLAQSDIQCTGWAIEARLAAEDPEKGYLPQTGQITCYEEPDFENVRIDSGIQNSSIVSHYYDSMLAKVIAKGGSRSAAIRKLIKALGAYQVTGVGTNKSFIKDVLALPEFTAGNHHTSTLKIAFSGNWKVPKPSAIHLSLAVLAGHLNMLATGASGSWTQMGSWRLTAALDRPVSAYYVIRSTDGENQDVELQSCKGCYSVLLDGELAASFKNARLDGSSISYENGGVSSKARFHINGPAVSVFDDNGDVQIQLLKIEDVYLSEKHSEFDGGNQVFAPMPGLIADVLVHKNQIVKKGEAVIVLEAMKLLQKLEATVSGVVSDVHFQIGDTPEKGALLLTIDPETKNS